ncbi:probable GABA transporter 2 [Primulina eburnea]|uniref:probable GABA transporter 2 n=1 Tax=Primulina eburnea TaxID=1245227 RepID=UPI003C6C48CD
MVSPETENESMSSHALLPNTRMLSRGDLPFSIPREVALNDPFHEIRREDDAGAAFVLESKGEWWHAGFHLTTAIVGPTILTLPYAFRGLGWGLGFLCLTAMGVVTFYSYYLMSLVLDHCEKAGRRHIRFRELAADVLGSGWMFYFVIFIQTAINTGISIGAILLAGQCLQIMYSNLSPHGPLKLFHFIAIVTVVMILLSQFPSFHSLRHINLGSLLLSFGYTFLVVGACINAGTSKNAPPKDYSLESSELSRVFSAFTSISIIAAIYGNGILPEIQATLAPPATGKMAKGLIMCYTVIFLTFYSAAVSGYWVFGNKSNSNILKSLMPDEGPSLAPVWLLGLAIIFVLLQLLAIGLVYSQVAYEIMERKSADVNQAIFSKRNLIPRIVLRSLYVIFCGFFAAMLPFFGDISAVVGAIGFIPLDFVLPMLLYNMTYKPTKSSPAYWINNSIIIIFTCVGLLGSFSSIRKLVLDAKEFKLFSDNVVG